MGYSHGQNWNEQLLKQELFSVMDVLQIYRMPTHSEMLKATGSNALAQALKRTGGTDYWAQKLGLDTKECDSKLGTQYEFVCKQYLEFCGFSCEITKARYPYDLLVNSNIKIDVKASNLYCGPAGNFFTFNLSKEMPTCDIFVCFCLKGNDFCKAYIIPSCVVSGKNQLSIGEKTSKYDAYKNAWHFVDKYNDFYNMLLQPKDGAEL